MPSPTKTLIVIPTYNERENLTRLIETIHRVVEHVHILIVDDHSPDGTGEMAEALSEKDDRIFVLRRPGKLGLGTAYLDGFGWGLERDYTFFQQMDCDFSHAPSDLPRFFSAMEDADLVLGSRYTAGGGTQNWPLRRKIMSRGGSFYASTILGLSIKDLTSGFKCFRREVLEAIPFEQVRSEGYAFQIEMTWRTFEAGFCVHEIPILFVDRSL
ncbi:MAG: polyprenol monophosphomannose synthase, partial [Myxococcota bacterium]